MGNDIVQMRDRPPIASTRPDGDSTVTILHIAPVRYNVRQRGSVTLAATTTMSFYFQKAPADIFDIMAAAAGERVSGLSVEKKRVI